MIATAISPAISGAMAEAASRSNARRSQAAANLYDKVMVIASQGVKWNERIEVRTIERGGATISIFVGREGASAAVFVSVASANTFGWLSSAFQIIRYTTKDDFAYE